MKSKDGFCPTTFISSFSSSSSPSGTRSSRILGSPINWLEISAAILASSASSSGTAFFSKATSDMTSLASPPCALICPISRLASLRRACLSCSSVCNLRLRASKLQICRAAAGKPLRAKAASNCSGLSLINRISCMRITPLSL